MSYVLVGIIFLLIAGAFVAYLLLTATKRSSPAREQGPPGVGADDAPLGDTEQHAGDQSSGRTVSGGDARTAGGTGAAAHEDLTRPDDGTADQGRFQRDKIGGEGEASPYIKTNRS